MGLTNTSSVLRDRLAAPPPQPRPLEAHAVSVALISSGELVRQGFLTLLDAHGERVSVVDLDHLDELRRPYVVLVDLLSLGTRALAHIDELVRAGYDPVAAFGPAQAGDEPERLGRVGARGLVPMDLESGQIVSSLELLAQLPASAPNPLQPAKTPLVLALEGVGCSPRETEVIALICRGLSNEEVAGELYVSINTVKAFIRGAYRKLGVSSRTQAVVWGSQYRA